MDIEIIKNNTLIYDDEIQDEMKQSYLTDLMGDDPRMRVFDFLLENHIFDYTKKEIADNSGVSRTTLDHFWNDLLRYGILLKTRTIGNGILFKLNLKNPIVKKMNELDLEITKAGSK